MNIESFVQKLIIFKDNIHAMFWMLKIILSDKATEQLKLDWHWFWHVDPGWVDSLSRKLKRRVNTCPDYPDDDIPF